MAKEEVIISVKTDAKSAGKDIDNVKKSTAETSNAASDAAQNFSVMGVSIGGIKTAFAKVIPIAKAMFTTIKGGIMATGIGALLIAFAALRQFFTDNEEGAAKLKTILAGIGVVTGNITDVLSNLGKAMFEAFSNPKQAIADLKDAIVQNVENRIAGLVQGFGALGKIVSGVFSGSLSQVKEGMKDFGEGSLQAFTGVEDLTQKISKNVGDFVKQTKEEVGVATQLEKDRLALQKFERQALVDKAKTESEIMKLRLQARDIEKFTNEERLGFMREANKLADEQLQKDLHVAEEKLRFQQVENSFSKSSQENLDAEAQLEATVFQIQRSNFSERKRMKSEEQALVREAAALQKAADKEEQDAIKKRLEIEKAVRQEIQTLQENEIEKSNEKFDKLIEQAKQNGIDTVELEKKKIKAVSDINAKFDADQAKKDDAQRAAAQQGLMTGLSTAQEVFGKESAAGKAAGIAQATINTYQAASKALAQFGVPLGIPFAALAVAAGFKQVQAIQNTPPPQLNRGGVIRGAGTGTSDSISARLSKGETVINARSSRMFKPLLSALNEAGGGVGFAEGGTLDTSLGGNTIGAVKAFVVTDDITESQNSLQKIRQKATI
tara:strand:+ start:7686 stop:9512 length:1827 start_codon:yes stop_codon:yes gene_type:complete